MAVSNNNLSPVPMGVTGELYTGGDGLARGYLNKAELTKEVFIENPFATESEKKSNKNTRLYKTGDLVRWLPDGNLDFIGRVDDQIKIRGFRIEPAEIESCLLTHPDVDHASVIAYQDNEGHQRLVAYLLVARGVSLDVPDLTVFLRGLLPHYMVPSLFVSLKSLPLTPTGKTDKSALPDPTGKQLSENHEYLPPRTPYEKLLTKIWAKVLKIKINSLSIKDNFFTLGGDSILSIQIVTTANQSGLNITPQKIFQYPTIFELAFVLEHQEANKQSHTEQGPGTGLLPLTPSQYWFFYNVSVEQSHFNQHCSFNLPEALDLDKLQQAIHIAAHRQESLRLRFHYDDTDSVWRQFIISQDEIEKSYRFDKIDLSMMSPESQADQIQQNNHAAQSQLNITEGPLLRVNYYDLGKQQRPHLFITIHHLAVDQSSWAIVLDEFDLLGFQGSSLKDQFYQIGSFSRSRLG